MKCPHCLENFHEEWYGHHIGNDSTAINWIANWCYCPACNRLVIRLNYEKKEGGGKCG